MPALDARKAIHFRDLRFTFFLYFGNLSLLSLAMALYNSPMKNLPAPSPREETVLIFCGGVFGAASWLAMQAWRSGIIRGRGWLVGASLLSFLIFLGLPLYLDYSRGVDHFWSLERIYWFPQAIGVIGIYAFSLKQVENKGEAR